MILSKYISIFFIFPLSRISKATFFLLQSLQKWKWNSEGMGGIYDWKSEGMGEFHKWDFWSR